MTTVSFSRISPSWPSLTLSEKPVRWLAVVPRRGPTRSGRALRGIRKKMTPPRAIVTAAARTVLKTKPASKSPGYGSAPAASSRRATPGAPAPRASRFR